MTELSSAERWKRSVRALLLWWLGAILCILIPVFHFVLVPLGLFLGLFNLNKILRHHYLTPGGEILCPECQQPSRLKAMSFNFPLRVSCAKCLHSLKIEMPN